MRGAWWVCALTGVSTLAGLAAAPAPAQDTTASVLDGIYTESQAARGAAGFQQYCAICHGASLAGLGEAPALVGAQFVADFNGLTVGDLFERIRTTMPLNTPSGLSRDQYADILAFMLKANGFPAGERELYRRSEFLNVIRFEAPAQGAGSAK
jgi:S-disulfanyl-L-cysteine oxidoreductase SoxD